MPGQNSPTPFPPVPDRDPYRERIDPEDHITEPVIVRANNQPLTNTTSQPVPRENRAAAKNEITAPISHEEDADIAEPAEEALLQQKLPRTTEKISPDGLLTPQLIPPVAPSNQPPNLTESPAQVIKPLPNVRTYASDAAQALRNQQATQATIAIAEAEKNHQGRVEIRTASRPNRHRGLNISLILILIAATAGLLGYVWFIAPQPGPLADFTPPREVITADSESKIDVSTLRDAALQSELTKSINKVDLSPKSVQTIYLTQGSGSLTHAITAADFLRLIDADTPATLVRTFDDRYAFGVQNIAGHNEPFLVFTINSFDTAFAGMLDWESTMEDDLSFLLNTSPVAQNFNQSTTTDGFNHSDFRDAVIQNHDVRFLPAPGDVAAGGDGVRLLYAFPNRNTLIITTSNTGFEHLLEHLNRQQPAE
jgi:hypothetical protein